MNENWFWKCPKCGTMNCAKDDYEYEYRNDFNTECQNPECRFEVTAFVSYSQPEFEFYDKDGESVEALDEKHRMDERIDNTPHAGTKWLTDVIEYDVIE